MLPPHVLEHVGVRLDPLFPKRSLPAETTVRRLLARIDGDTLDLAVGRWLADRRNRTQGRLRGLVDGLVFGSGRESVNPRLMIGAGCGCGGGGTRLGRTWPA